MSLQEAWAAYEADNPGEAIGILCRVLNDDPDCYPAVVLMSSCYAKAEWWGMAYVLARHATESLPDQHEGWTNLGRFLVELDRYDEAEQCLYRAYELAPDEFTGPHNMGLLAANTFRHEEALWWCAKAAPLAVTEDQKADLAVTRSLPLLAQRRWQEGWECYRRTVGKMPHRPDVSFAGEGRWDGSPGKTVIVYGEQGLGDEIMFASCLPDAMRDAEIVLECEPRLAGLFRRSFGLRTYGTRRSRERAWAAKYQPDAHCIMGDLAGLYRSNGEFPRKPFLIPDPGRRAVYRKRLDALGGRRKIGLAWTGGLRNTRSADRSVSLEDLGPILDLDADFISLQYKGDVDHPKVHHWPEIVQSDDYDDTAALVAELDCVVSVTTTVALLCGAIGTPCHVLVPEHPTWHWAAEGEMPWFDLMLYRRKGGWSGVIGDIAERLSDGFGAGRLGRAEGA